ncbi:YitT family protein [Mangrovicoccus ximenensis]|uniref:YitT family protein n=1 Tax=Mangrovicoccus ximenensis TaxID=1911570 RepID=UPI000D34C6EB|nr:YitT family protein [Mangrovicoccus ximenensis]
MPAPMPIPATDATEHSVLDDVQGLSTGIVMCSLGLVLLTHLGFMTGQTAGAAVIISYLTGYSFGKVFFVINLPFYWLAVKRMGWEFILKSLGCVTALAVCTDYMPLGFQIERLNPYLGVAFFGTVTGIGLLAIFRHGGSLGGLGIVALYIQDNFGFRAGYVQLIVDAVLFLIAALLFPFTVVYYSLIGAAILNILIAFNHRRDRYIAR